MPLTHTEITEIDAANASGRPVVMFVHGLWLLSNSWDRWRRLFENAGYSTIAPGWPDDPATVDEAKRDPDVFAHKMIGTVSDHYSEAIGRLQKKPCLIGHSFGGLIVQRLAGLGIAEATVAIDPAPFRGVLPLPASALKSSSAVLGNPANLNRAVALTFEQFQYGWANNLDEGEARELYETFHVPASGVPIFQAATANLNPWTEARVETRNADRGPLLIIAGENDHTVPLAITRAMTKVQSRNLNPAVTIEVPGRGHSLVIDHGWPEVATIAVEWIDQVREDALKGIKA